MDLRDEIAALKQQLAAKNEQLRDGKARRQLLTGSLLADGATPFPATVPQEDFNGPGLDGLHAGWTLRVDDAGDPPFATPDFAALAEVGIKAAVSVPLIIGGKLMATLSLHQHTARHWTEAEVTLLEEVAERLWADLVRARTEETLRESEEKFRSLFENMGQGYGMNKIVRDADGRAVDLRYLELNPAFERLTGARWSEARGRLASEVFPGLDHYWVEVCDRAAATGVIERIEHELTPNGRWYQSNFYPIGGDRVLSLYEDITDRKRAEALLRESEERQAFLLRLSDTLRVEPDADAVAHRAMEMLIEHLGIDRSYIFFWDLENDIGYVTHQAGNDRAAPLPPTMRPSDFPASVRVSAAGTLVIDNIHEHPDLPDTDRANIAGVGMTALVSATLRKGGHPLWSMVAVTGEPRGWTPGEVNLVEEVAERTWAAIERVRTEAALRESEERRDLALEATQLGTFVWHVEEDRGEPDARMLALFEQPPNSGLTLRDAIATMIHPEDGPRYAAAVAEATRADGPRKLQTDIRVRRGDGSWRWLEIRARVTFTDSGEPLSMAGTALDISERWAAEISQRESEERFRQFAAASAAGLWIRDAESLSMEFVSAAVATIYGVETDALLGDVKRWASMIVPEIASARSNIWRRRGAGKPWLTSSASSGQRTVRFAGSGTPTSPCATMATSRASAVSPRM